MEHLARLDRHENQSSSTLLVTFVENEASSIGILVVCQDRDLTNAPGDSFLRLSVVFAFNLDRADHSRVHLFIFAAFKVFTSVSIYTARTIVLWGYKFPPQNSSIVTDVEGIHKQYCRSLFIIFY